MTGVMQFGEISEVLQHDPRLALISPLHTRTGIEPGELTAAALAHPARRHR